MCQTGDSGHTDRITPTYFSHKYLVAGPLPQLGQELRRSFLCFTLINCAFHHTASSLQSVMATALTLDFVKKQERLEPLRGENYPASTEKKWTQWSASSNVYLAQKFNSKYSKHMYTENREQFVSDYKLICNTTGILFNFALVCAPKNNWSNNSAVVMGSVFQNVCELFRCLDVYEFEDSSTPEITNELELS